MDISEVAKLSGLAASTLRYYEEKGLIRSVGRNGLRRQFSPKVLERLALIALGGRVGFSLEEMGAMFAPQLAELDREVLLGKAQELDKKITELTRMRDGLRHAAACEAANHFECPKFLRILRIAGQGGFKKSNRTKTSI